jgi:cell division protein FtsB
MKSKIINRVFQYLDYKGIPHTRFEKEVGFSNGYLNTQLKRCADLGESAIRKIIDYCLDLNEVWLITGKGEMLKPDAANNKEEEKPEAKTQPVPEPETTALFSMFMERCEKLASENGRLKAENEQLKAENEELRAGKKQSEARNEELKKHEPRTYGISPDAIPPPLIAAEPEPEEYV